MSLLVVATSLLAVTLLCRAAVWSAALLRDEDRYLRAVGPLAHSPAFARISGHVAATVIRRRHGRRSAAAQLTAVAASVVTRRAMTTRAFGLSWAPAQRTFHRLRAQRRVPARRRAAVAMVALATVGHLVGALGPAPRRRPQSLPLRVGRRI